MRFLTFENKAALGEALGERIAEEIREKPNLILGLATGSSPLETYGHLAKEVKEGRLSFQKVRSFNLDEYIDCPIEQETYRAFMNDNLFSKVDIDLNNTHFPSSNNPEGYDEEIAAAGGIDFQVLGIGRNGHIGFNEPGTPADSKTSVIHLTQSTIDANARFFGNDKSLVPTKAVSMGLATIMGAKKIALIANDTSKLVPIMGLMKGEKDVLKNPSAVLLDHPDVTIYLTKDLADAIAAKMK